MFSGNAEDRKSTRLNSSHVEISYAVFCLKKKKHKQLVCGQVGCLAPVEDCFRDVRSEVAEAYVPLEVGWFFFFNDTATTEIYTLSLHDALPIGQTITLNFTLLPGTQKQSIQVNAADRKSTRLNSSHVEISYAVFCLKKKNP